MKVGVIQSSFVPWRGYFDFIASVDLFVIYDDVQFSKGSWRNRNKIKTEKGTQWLTVPVKHTSLQQLIDETAIDNQNDWRASHLKKISTAYGSTPYFEDLETLLANPDLRKSSTISQLNLGLIQSICGYLGIRTPIASSREWSLTGRKTERLIDLLTQLGAKSYLSGPSADSYLDKSLFQKNGISLEYKSYNYRSYPQPWGPFEGNVSILDLIANCGVESCNYLSSETPDIVVIS